MRPTATASPTMQTPTKGNPSLIPESQRHEEREVQGEAEPSRVGGDSDGASSSGGSTGSGGYEDEPVLKYQRMGADVGKVLSRDQEEQTGAGVGAARGKRESVVSMTVHDSCLVRVRVQTVTRPPIHIAVYPSWSADATVVEDKLATLA